MSRRRCAIYTRKSSEEGLDQSFNSLDAQREACEAYVKSQAGEGWKLSPTTYDDGGFSGGSMDRPGLKRLLADIAAGLIDVVVVYKVDRLTRSLGDFARIVEVLDASGASFVSITQAFNTTTSMGRLTLNVLLSFAQFEREVTGERIRDKIAASKAKGMWMGGNVPLGYDAGDNTLTISSAEAETVRHIFRRYIELASVYQLQSELETEGVRSKQRTNRAGALIGGGVLRRGALFHLLRNRVYLGKITHRDKVYVGNHPPIIDQETFDAAQALLDANQRRRGPSEATEAPPLGGLLHDSLGRLMTPTHTQNRHGRTYRYYRSAAGPRGKAQQVSAAAIEDFVASRLRGLMADPSIQWSRLKAHVMHIDLRSDGVSIDFRTDALDDRELPISDRLEVLGNGSYRLVTSATPITRGGRTWLRDGSHQARPRPDTNLIRCLRRAHEILRENGLAPVAGIQSLPEAHGVADPYRRKMVELAFLAPDIQRAILTGRQPIGMTVQRLLAAPIPLAWDDQCTLFGFGRA